MEARAVGCNYGFLNINTESDARFASGVYTRLTYNSQALLSPGRQELATALNNIPQAPKILFFSGHGNSRGMMFKKNGNSFQIRLGNPSLHSPTLDLTGYLNVQTECVIYGGCETAKGNGSIAERSYTAQHAKHSIGWEKTVGAYSHTRWLVKFHQALLPYNGDWEDAITEANIGCCFCWFTDVKSVRHFHAPVIITRSGVLHKSHAAKDPIWSANGQEIRIAPNQPQPVLDFLAKLTENFSRDSWKVIFTGQGDDNYCADVVLMKDDVYTSSSFTVFIRNNCLDSVYDARLEIPAKASFKNGVSDVQAQKRLADIATTLQNRGFQILHQMWYRFYDAEKNQPSIILLTKYQFTIADSGRKDAVPEIYTGLQEEQMF